MARPEPLRRALESLSAPERAAFWRQYIAPDALLDPPRVTGIEKLAGGAVTLRTIARVDPYRRDDVARDLRLRIKLALDRSGIVTFVPPVLPIA